MTPPTDADNNFVAGRRPGSTKEEPIAFMTRPKVEVMLKKWQEKASASLINLDLKHPNPAKIVAKPYIADIWLHNSRSSMSEEATHENMLCASLILWNHIMVTKTYV